MMTISKPITQGMFFIIIVFVLCVQGGCCLQHRDTVVAGQGWEPVVLGAHRSTVEEELGTPSAVKKYAFDDGYFADYTSRGIQVRYGKDTDTVLAISFFNGQVGKEHFSPMDIETDMGVDFSSTEDDVLGTYGKPLFDHSSESKELYHIFNRRIVYPGIDFRFENGTMVRISVPGQ